MTNTMKIYWTHNDRVYTGTAGFENNEISFVADEKNNTFDSLCADECENGITPMDVWEDLVSAADEDGRLNVTGI